ncbi:hypothetical protein DL89DRAFT_82606 [Linderina pennispora]|uniref:Uncharacterized protein n=1 Tax=Linderina pennispora TaxID=61395 RepID=A0A1Y1WHE2_9FUNG|nr:uncharacterized protein DL89DRAFT_82606 [Linderina pennispora]ORX72758.1 hypothetical protein DL89DRAFT_82606 [Linderina pennispora]
MGFHMACVLGRFIPLGRRHSRIWQNICAGQTGNTGGGRWVASSRHALVLSAHRRQRFAAMYSWLTLPHCLCFELSSKVVSKEVVAKGMGREAEGTECTIHLQAQTAACLAGQVRHQVAEHTADLPDSSCQRSPWLQYPNITSVAASLMPHCCSVELNPNRPIKRTHPGNACAALGFYKKGPLLQEQNAGQSMPIAIREGSFCHFILLAVQTTGSALKHG